MWPFEDDINYNTQVHWLPPPFRYTSKEQTFGQEADGHNIGLMLVSIQESENILSEIVLGMPGQSRQRLFN